MALKAKTIKLSEKAAINQEMKAFLDLHPEFEQTQENINELVGYMDRNDMLISTENAHEVFKFLCEHGRLKVRPHWKTMLPHLTHEETQALLKEQGVAMVDSAGNFAGYGFPEEGFRMPLVDTKNRQPSGAPLPIRDEQLQYDLEHPPKSKADMESWTADRYRNYLVATGSWNKALPEHLR